MSQADDESSDFLSAGGWCGFLRTPRSVERRKRITPTCGLAGHRVSVLAVEEPSADQQVTPPFIWNALNHQEGGSKLGV
jgi:hypothetical protein